MKKQEIKKEIATPKQIEKLEIKDMKQVKGGFVVIEDAVGFYASFLVSPFGSCKSSSE